MSDEILPGQRWLANLTDRLEQCSAGILCVTDRNQRAPWLNFEAGALGKLVSQSYVCPYLFGMSASRLISPLSQFNACEANEDGTRRLLRSLEAACDIETDLDSFERRFRKWWPDLDADLSAIHSRRRLRRRRKTRYSYEVLTRIKNDIDALLDEGFGAEYIGKFPAFMGDICNCLAKAKKELWIACDYADYGAFSANKRYREYRELIRTILDSHHPEPHLRMLVLADPQKHVTAQFGNPESNVRPWKEGREPQFKKALDKFAEFCRDTGIHVPTLEEIRETPQRFFDCMKTFGEREFEQIYGKIQKENFGRIHDVPMPLFLWIADNTMAVFSVQCFGDNFSEHGFVTYNKSLIETLRSFWNELNENCRR
ncbi:MAG TPA: hypothetical protein VFI31_15405 [Pirellulales bacterium]|nr:hypothetical protein [Pirellulales bacterium]